MTWITDPPNFKTQEVEKEKEFFSLPQFAQMIVSNYIS
jgi:hypothetical protein